MDALLGSVKAALDAVPVTMGRGDGIGSNSWVVAGSRTTTGKPLLANDPHLGVSIPGIWYQTGLHCRTVNVGCPFDVAGFSFAGLPGIVIGHNAKVSWGFTNLGPDVTDFYLEKVTDATYLRDGKEVPLTVSTETIKVAGGNDVTLPVLQTVHGPILSGVVESIGAVGRNPLVRMVPQQDTYAVSLAWTGLVPSATADAIFELNTAQDFTQFRAAARKFAVPAQNLVYADTDGHIGYQAPGMIPVRSTSVPNTPPGYWPAPGWDSQYDWRGYVPFEELPWTEDPKEGFIITANQQVTAAPTAPFLTTEWDYGFRADRIREMLEATPKISPQQMSAMQLDTRNGFAPVLVQALLAINLSADPVEGVGADEFTQQAQVLLADWDFTQPADKSKASVRAAFFNAVYMRLLEYTFNDELPNDIKANGGARWMVAMTRLLKEPSNPWWDDRKTPGVTESRDEILRKALVRARLDLAMHLGKEPVTWSWGKLHTVTFRHQVLGGESAPDIVQDIFNRGPIGLPGGPAIVNANGWDASKNNFEVRTAPSMRMVVDLADLDSSTWVNQTGNSGHPYGPHYIDQADAWAGGETYPWPSTTAAIDKAKAEELVLTPRPGS
jgi:penicillin amidase